MSLAWSKKQTNKNKPKKPPLFKTDDNSFFLWLTHSLIHSFIEQTVEGSMFLAPSWDRTQWCVLGLILMVFGVQEERVLSAEGWGQVFTGLSLEPGWKRCGEGILRGAKWGREAGQTPDERGTIQEKELWCSWRTGNCPACDGEHSRPGDAAALEDEEEVGDRKGQLRSPRDG